MHLPRLAALISCAFIAKILALPTPVASLDGRDVTVINVREESRVAVPPPWRREETIAGLPAWKREESIPPPPWKREDSIPLSPSWKRSADPNTPSLRSGEAEPPDWKREELSPEAGGAAKLPPDWRRDSSSEEYPTSPAWRRDTS
jgi:hypothetical protein